MRTIGERVREVLADEMEEVAKRHGASYEVLEAPTMARNGGRLILLSGGQVKLSVLYKTTAHEVKATVNGKPGVRFGTEVGDEWGEALSNVRTRMQAAME